jgi:hypothetical protein
MMHWLGEMQSVAEAQGKAHLLYCVLQWCSPHEASFWHGRASGPGTAMVPVAGAVGVAVG